MPTNCWETMPNGNKYHYNDAGRYDRIIFPWGETRYYDDAGLLHREDGPAVEYADPLIEGHYFLHGGHIPGGAEGLVEMRTFFEKLANGTIEWATPE